METIKDLSKKQTTENLLQFYANAQATWFECSGNFKSGKNRFFMDTYAGELKERGIDVDKVELPLGQWNGEGSY